MASWAEFVAGAPGVSQTFLRRHAATGGLCLLATLRSGLMRVLEKPLSDTALVESIRRALAAAA